MMKKLFVDDVRDTPDETWILARDVPTAKDFIQTVEFDVMSLDHDIGFQMVCHECLDEERAKNKDIGKENSPTLIQEIQAKLIQGGCKHHETGTGLAQWMVDNLKKWPKLIVVHSANPYGAERMMSLLGPKTRCVRIAYNKATLRSIRWKSGG